MAHTTRLRGISGQRCPMQWLSSRASFSLPRSPTMDDACAWPVKLEGYPLAPGFGIHRLGVAQGGWPACACMSCSGAQLSNAKVICVLRRSWVEICPTPERSTAIFSILTTPLALIGLSAANSGSRPVVIGGKTHSYPPDKGTMATDGSPILRVAAVTASAISPE